MNSKSRLDEVRKLYFNIGEVARECLVQTSCIRFWEEELGMKVARSRGGIRKYSRDQLAELMRVAAMRSEGFGLKWLKAHREERNISMDFQNIVCE